MSRRREPRRGLDAEVPTGPRRRGGRQRASATAAKWGRAGGPQTRGRLSWTCVYQSAQEAGLAAEEPARVCAHEQHRYEQGRPAPGIPAWPRRLSLALGEARAGRGAGSIVLFLWAVDLIPSPACQGGRHEVL